MVNFEELKDFFKSKKQFTFYHDGKKLVYKELLETHFSLFKEEDSSKELFLTIDAPHCKYENIKIFNCMLDPDFLSFSDGETIFQINRYFSK